jgi:lipopolysaccharide export system permease protein
MSGLIFLHSINASKEIFTIFTSGVSIWGIILPIIFILVIVGAISTTVAQPFSAMLLRKYDVLEAKITNTESKTVAISNFGIIMSEKYNDERRLIIMRSVDFAKNTASDVIILFTDEENNFQKRVDAKTIKFETNAIKIEECFVFDHQLREQNNVNRTKTSITIPSSISIDKIREGYNGPEYLSFWRIKSMMRVMRDSGVSTIKYQIYFWKQMLRPLTLIASILIATCFTSVTNKRRSIIRTFVFGIVIGFFSYIFTEISISILVRNDIAPMFAVFGTALITILLCVLVILYLHET